MLLLNHLILYRTNNYQAKQNCIVTKQRVYHEKVIAVYENIY